jgi:hypothetical protein
VVAERNATLNFNNQKRRFFVFVIASVVAKGSKGQQMERDQTHPLRYYKTMHLQIYTSTFYIVN